MRWRERDAGHRLDEPRRPDGHSKRRIRWESLSEELPEKASVALVAFQEPVKLILSPFPDLHEFDAYLIKTSGRVPRNVIPADLADGREWRLIRNKFDG